MQQNVSHRDESCWSVSAEKNRAIIASKTWVDLGRRTIPYIITRALPWQHGTNDYPFSSKSHPGKLFIYLDE